jgi:hypothetical protein
MALSAEEVSGFCFSSLTPETLRYGAESHQVGKDSLLGVRVRVYSRDFKIKHIR